MSEAQEEWAKIQDAAERRKIQNRNAQRKYRRNLKRRVEDLERQNAYISFSSGTSTAVHSPTSSPTSAKALLKKDIDVTSDHASLRQLSTSPSHAFEHSRGNSTSSPELVMINSVSNDWMPPQTHFLPTPAMIQTNQPTSNMTNLTQSPSLSTPSSLEHDGQGHMASDSLMSLSTLNDYMQSNAGANNNNNNNGTLLEDNMGSPGNSSSNSEELQFPNSFPPSCQGFCLPQQQQQQQQQQQRGVAPFGRTTLHLAAMKGYLPIVQMLVERGLDINARDNQGWTALHLAAEKGQDAVVKCLLDHGADLYARI